MTIPLFFHFTLHDATVVAHRLPEGARRVIDGGVRAHGVVLAVWALAIIGLILHRFWSFWSSLVGA